MQMSGGTFLVLLSLLINSARPGEETDEDDISNQPNNGQEPRLPRTRVIRTKYGQVQGRTVQLVPSGAASDDHLGKVEVYYGIPYATPPVGSNRWEPTRAPSPWEGVLQATSPGPVCPQRIPDVHGNGNESEALLRMPRPRLRFLQLLRSQLLRQSEDCLYLNIFVPAPNGHHQQQGTNNKLPVMVYVHGESFKWGSGNLWDGRVLASYGNVIVVTFNYRLGVLGFLNTNGSPLTRGQVANYGIMDQMAVLQWVQENIGQFGGDPSSVTLFGHGTGAACIEYLTHSPTTVPGLFHRVILMSGSLFAPWARVREPLNYAVQLGRKFNCTIPTDLTNEHEKIVNCLRNVSAEQLLAAKLNVPSFHLDFGPSFDGVTIKDNFADIKGKRSFGTRTYEAMVGVVTHDYFDELSDAEVRHGLAVEQRDRMLQTFVRNHYSAHLQEILLTLQNEYTDWEQSVQHPSTVREQVLQAFSDGLYGSPAIFSVGTFARKTKNTYFYHFAHHTKLGPYGQLRSGSTHGSELSYVFGIPLSNVWQKRVLHQFTKSEVVLSKAVMTYWTNFAKSGSPNKPVRYEDDARSRYRTITWEGYDQHQTYLELGLRPRLQHHYRGHKMSIWLSLIPQLQKTGQNSIYPSHNSLTLEGPSWGVIRNASSSSSSSHTRANIDSKVKGPSPPSTTCMTLSESAQVFHHHNDTLSRLEAASRTAYSYALGITVGLGGVLCVLNGMLLLCLCQRRDSGRKRHDSSAADPHSMVSASGSAVDYIGCSQPSTPQVVQRGDHVHVHGRSNPTVEFASLTRSSGQRAALVMQQDRYRSCNGGNNRQLSSGSPSILGTTSYVGVARPEPVDHRPSSSMSGSTATIRVRSATSRRTPQKRSSALLELEPIPAPPAQFENDEDVCCNVSKPEEMALIKSPPQFRGGNSGNVTETR